MVWLTIFLLVGCSQSPEPAPHGRGGNAEPESSVTADQETHAIVSEPLTPASHSESGLRFNAIEGSQSGIEFQNLLEEKHIVKYLLNGAGVCTGDYDNDGLTDLFAVSQDGSNRLYRQVSPWKFEDVTVAAGVEEESNLWGTGASFADVDSDGLLDLFVCNINGPNFLYINNGNGGFIDRSAEYGLEFDEPTTMASFCDYDNDGDLDLYLLNNRIFGLGDPTQPNKYKMLTLSNGEKAVHPDYRHEYFFLNGKIQDAGYQDRLLRNDGGSFSDVTKSSGIGGYDMGLSATWWDFNHDGWQDLYVGNDLQSPDHLYLNQSDGTFKDIIADAVGHTTWSSMGSDSADLNNDGLVDLVSADMSSTTHYKQKTTMGEMGSMSWFLTMGRPRQFMRNTCYINSGTTRFWEAANLTGLDSTDWTWSVKLNDFDNDGRVDAYFTNGVAKNINDSDKLNEYKKLRAEGRDEEAEEQIRKLLPLDERNLFFRNVGNLKFKDVSEKWGADDLGSSHGCAVADFDRDGDLDMVVNHMNRPLGLFRNDTADSNSILVRLRGVISNSFGLGAEVEIEAAGSRQIRQLKLARGYMSADEPLIHFGLGDAEVIDELTVKWPSGVVQRFEHLAANHLHTITESGKPDDWTNARETGHPERNSETIFAEKQIPGLNSIHSELEYDDFQHQPLLPNKLSQLGPGMAWGDVNADGRSDCYVCGARGQIGTLLIQTDNGDFETARGPWAEQTTCEEMGALFFDVDSDGDQDLYVVNGGYEAEQGSELLADRLYINDGSGEFEVAGEDTLPDLRLSGSCVCASDFDRDGDLDLFVGTRMTPRRWPVPVSSTILRNDNGQLVEATEVVAPGLETLGLVTGAIWSDADDDGWADLIVTLEWGAVTMFKNESGQLVDRTDQAGLAGELGWWNSIAAGDVDHDGDIDYVAMNTGLNTKYHADHHHPVTLYAHDFDDSGRIDLVESEWEGDKCFPIRGKSCSTHAMPMVSEKFPTYHEFALAELSDIYGEDSLSAASKFTANNLSSVLLLNDGNGNFEFRELPRLAQISPGFGVAIADFTGDGNADIVIGQNFLNPQPETGQMDGGLGLLLKGNGKGEFEPVGPRESGIVIEQQAMGLSVVDLNGDAAPDFAVTTNDGPMRYFENMNATVAGNRQISVSVVGPAGNPTGIGSRIRLICAKEAASELMPEASVTPTAIGIDDQDEAKSGLTSAQKIVAELYGGSGYLSQSVGKAFFSIDQSQKIEAVEVILPTGESFTKSIAPDQLSITVEADR